MAIQGNESPPTTGHNWSEVQRIGHFDTPETAPVARVTIVPRGMGQSNPMRILEFSNLIGYQGFYRWIAAFSVTVKLDRQIEHYTVDFLSEEEREAYTAHRVKARRREEVKRRADEVWADFMGRLQ